MYHAKQLVAPVVEAVPAGENSQVRDRLPTDYEPLFEFVDSTEA